LFGLSLIKLRLQDLTMILHALDISLRIRRLLRSSNIDVPIGKNGGRHVKLGCRLFFFVMCLTVDEDLEFVEEVLEAVVDEVDSKERKVERGVNTRRLMEQPLRIQEADACL